MNTIPGIALLFLLLGLLVLVGWYLLIKTEGIYLGWRIVILLYDLYANRYDRIKSYNVDYERWFLARPLIRHLRPNAAPLILDVATGTGRLPVTLLEEDDFNGHVIGLDLSRKMLFQAAVNLAGFRGRYDLVWETAMALPFEDDIFDVVTCLEALEFFPRLLPVLREMIRVLRPGGTLLLSNRVGSDARLLPGKAYQTDQLVALLESIGWIATDVERWQVDYDLVWARKAGDSLPTGGRPVAEVLRCPVCNTVNLIPLESGEWVCGTCESRTQVGPDGVIELFRLKR